MGKRPLSLALKARHTVMAVNCQHRKRWSAQGMVLVRAFCQDGKQQRHSLNLLPTNYTNANLLPCKFLAKVIQEPKSTGSISSALSKYSPCFLYSFF